MSKRGEEQVRPFGRRHPREPPSLREFEEDFRIESREGKGFWKSDYPSVQNLLTHLWRGVGSESTRDEYLRTLHVLTRRAGLDPDELACLDREEAESLAQGLADSLVERGCNRRYANNVMETLKTFFRVNGHRDFDLDRFFTLRRSEESPYYVPKNGEVHEMADSAGSPRNRAIVLLLWTTGLRVSTLVALNYGDIREKLERGEKYPQIKVLPRLKERNPDACKSKVPYYTFAHPLALRPLRAYLRLREGMYGPLEDDYPLFHSKWHLWTREKRTERRLTRRSVQRVVKKSAKRAGIAEWEDVCTRSLRKSYKSVLRSPTLDGVNLSIETQEFLMGHILPGRLEEYYDRENEEHHRKMYSKLDFRRKGTSGEGEEVERTVGPEELSRHLDNGWLFVEKEAEDKFTIRRGRL